MKCRFCLTELPATGTHVCNNGWVVTKEPIKCSNPDLQLWQFVTTDSTNTTMADSGECVTTTVNAIFALIVDLTKEEQTELYTKLHDSFDHCRIYPR